MDLSFWFSSKPLLLVLDFKKSDVDLKLWLYILNTDCANYKICQVSIVDIHN